MGRHFYLGLLILLVLLLASAAAGYAMSVLHAPAQTLLSEASENALSGNMEKAIALSEDAYAHWRRFYSLTACVADHTPMDEVERLFAEIKIYAQADDAVHFAACCSELACLVSTISDAHLFSWWNLL